ncbi:efflux RND transporter periplasmic adaptor subunit [Salipiger sp. 1_MG-2023]|uniref:efflux RND transporter periplasmic adaptor subunit n=1 Tax=Salipiger sp. 1_MG-2023 TaxID=3062665 RepID=UPI0026E42623|nr:efflux RND transporter periplasmic adaptor subunit [Salipiger sp. 1_MG-2023]MDO6586648.1 efflux RND transporter periplasmic adaptor subunit [Salipiger sp. 1_MG-2023]
MRPVSILTAIVVIAVLYGVVMERDRLLGWARDIAPAEQPESAAAPAPAPEDAPGTVAVMALHSQAQEIDDAVLLRGQTQASREVQVAAEIAGRVISEPIPGGTEVMAGDLLCRLDPGTTGVSLIEAEAALAEARAQRPQVEARIPEAEAALLQAQARQEESQINLTAAEKLSQSGYSSRTSLAAARANQRAAEAGVRSAEAGIKAAASGIGSLEAQIESARAGVARAKTDVDNLDITAPFAGVLETDTAELGTLMSVGTRCATVLQLDPIKLVGYVPETDVSRVMPGARAGARLAGGETVSGTVTHVASRADETTRTFLVEITLPNPGHAIRAGQTVEIGIEAAGALAHLVPQSALTLDDDGRLGVRSVAGDGTAMFLPVTVLRDTRAGIWLGGLPRRVDIITVGQEYVTDGVPVTASFESVLP